MAFTMLSKNFYAIISAVFQSKIDRIDYGYNTQLLRPLVICIQAVHQQV